MRGVPSKFGAHPEDVQGGLLVAGRLSNIVEYSVRVYLRRARLRTRVDEVDVRGRRGARSATLPRRRAYARFDVRRRDAQSVSGSLGRQVLLLCSVIKGLRHGYIATCERVGRE